jgi:hypothetical protein
MQIVDPKAKHIDTSKLLGDASIIGSARLSGYRRGVDEVQSTHINIDISKAVRDYNSAYEEYIKRPQFLTFGGFESWLISHLEEYRV